MFGTSDPGPRGPKGGQGVLLEVRVDQTMLFWENFIKLKLKNALGFLGTCQVRSGVGPLPGLKQQVQVSPEGLGPWSLG